MLFYPPAKKQISRLALRSILLVSILLLFFVNFSFAQTKRGNIWCFGKNAGLDFNSGTAVPIGPNSINAYTENCASTCDEFGNLLFYTRGDSVWDKTNIYMPNGYGLKGHVSASQGVLITPVIGSCSRYYVFTAVAYEQWASPQGLNYSIVDMSLPGNGNASCPLGDIDAAYKNIKLTNLLVEDTLDEKVTSVMHANGTDYWIIVKLAKSNTYYSYLVTAAGINPIPVQSVTGIILSLSGYMKPSKDGKQILNVKAAKFFPFGFGKAELIDFNDATGVLSNAQAISTVNRYFDGGSFSCNDSVIYVTAHNSFGVNDLYSYQRFAPVISATENLVANNLYPGSLQLAVDGKIYLPDFLWPTVSVVNNPNSLAAPGFAQSTINLVPTTEAELGTPNFFHGYEREFCNAQTNSLFTNVHNICSGDQVSIGSASLVSCHNYSWSPATGLSNTSSPNPSANPASTQTYTLTIVTMNCDTVMDTVRVNVTQTPVAAINGNLTICVGQSTILTATGGGAYSWIGGPMTSTISVNPASPTSYSVVVSNGACVDTSDVLVNVVQKPVAAIAGNLTLCAGQNLMLTASGGGSYSWSNGPISNTMTVSPGIAATYSVIVSNGSCNDTAYASVTITPLPQAIISGSIIICSGNSTILSASGAGALSWSPGPATTTISVSPTTSTKYYLQATNNCGTDIDSVMVLVNDLPIINISGDDTICKDELVVLNASGAIQYSWTPLVGLSASTGSNVTASPQLPTLYIVTGTDANGCVNTRSINIVVITPPLLNPSPGQTIFSGNSVALSAGGSGSITYQWFPSAGLSCTTCANPIASPDGTTKYYILVTDANGYTNLDSVIVTVKPMCDDLFIPNVFSPNGDGQNDIFYVRGSCFKVSVLKIYNRWGEKIFESQDINYGWDGKQKGKDMDANVFTILFTAIDINNEEINVRKSITLMR